MIDVTFKVANVDLSGYLSTYKVSIEREVQESITTMDGKEHVTEFRRPVIVFSFRPLSDAEANSIYACLSSGKIEVKYTNPLLNADATDYFRVTTPIENLFGLRSINGKRYYKGNQITLRQLTVI